MPFADPPACGIRISRVAGSDLELRRDRGDDLAHPGPLLRPPGQESAPLAGLVNVLRDHQRLHQRKAFVPEQGRTLPWVVLRSARIRRSDVVRNPFERDSLLASGQAHAPGERTLLLAVDLQHGRELTNTLAPPGSSAAAGERTPARPP